MSVVQGLKVESVHGLAVISWWSTLIDLPKCGLKPQRTFGEETSEDS